MTTKRRVWLVAQTEIQPGAFTELEEETGWEADTSATGAEALVEFAGRGCYESWDRPNPTTAHNAGYLAHILDVGHFSVIEHGSLTYYVRGVSRSLTHELVRHRHFSYSQLSQRYVDPGAGGSNMGLVVPPVLEDDEEGRELLLGAWEDACRSYDRLYEHLKRKNPDATRKEWRQAARSVLPNATETRLVVTGNFRALRHFFGMRCTAAADDEIRGLALEMLSLARSAQPSIFGDFQGAVDGDLLTARTPNREV